MELQKIKLRFFISCHYIIKHNEIIEMFFNILKGVKYFHNRKVIHRDINNIPVITDFGIANFSEDDLITNVETKIGTKLVNFKYTAPEQRDRKSEVTYKTDIYSLGLIFNEMFTKKIMFGSSYKKVEDINNNYTFLDNIIDKMVKQDPKERYDSIEDIESCIVTIHSL